ARLSHPRLLRARDFRRAGGRCFFTYDFVPGEDIASWFRGKRPADLLSLLHQALDVLRFLHARGVLHLDLKPSNLIVAARRGRARLTLIDFGIHRWLRSRPAPRFGTPPFAAPEVLAGKRPDARSDLFSLGVTFRRLLPGPESDRGPPDGELASALREL